MLEVGALWTQRAPRLGDTLALVRRSGAEGTVQWCLPGGPVRSGETLAEALVRTVEEDLAVEALCGPFVGWFEVPDQLPHRVVMVFHLAVLDAPRGDDLPDGARMVPDWEVPELPLRAGVAEFLADQGLIELLV